MCSGQVLGTQGAQDLEPLPVTMNKAEDSCLSARPCSRSLGLIGVEGKIQGLFRGKHLKTSPWLRVGLCQYPSTPPHGRLSPQTPNSGLG